MDALVGSKRTPLLRHLARALRFFENYPDKSKRRAALGHTDWWKLQVLLYLLRHPRPAYRTRELREHLASIGLRISPKDIRRFCSRHNIHRDMRAGRPRKAETVN